jgi:hypothetical protein
MTSKAMASEITFLTVSFLKSIPYWSLQESIRFTWDFFRLIARRFPYAIYYKVRGEEIVVYRVLDCRRKPERVEQELSISESIG